MTISTGAAVAIASNPTATYGDLNPIVIGLIVLCMLVFIYLMFKM